MQSSRIGRWPHKHTPGASRSAYVTSCSNHSSLASCQVDATLRLMISAMSRNFGFVASVGMTTSTFSEGKKSVVFRITYPLWLADFRITVARTLAAQQVTPVVVANVHNVNLTGLQFPLCLRQPCLLQGSVLISVFSFSSTHGCTSKVFWRKGSEKR